MTMQRIRLESIEDVQSHETLYKILSLIDNPKALFWTLISLEACEINIPDLDLCSFESQIRHRKKGLEVSWDELIYLSDKFTQIYNMTLIASKNIESLKVYDDEKKMYSSCDMVIEMFDSTDWTITSNDFQFIKKIEASFNEAVFIKEGGGDPF